MPAKKPDQTPNEAEDEAIQLLINSSLKDLEFDGHSITNVPVKCDSATVIINGKEYDNDIIPQDEAEKVQKIMEDNKMTRRKLMEEYPDIGRKLCIILKHVDNRSHGFCYRKCSPLKSYSCDYCKNAPPRSSDRLWRSLPQKNSGGLFYDFEPDTDNPGHYKTLLQLIKNADEIVIKPDSMFKEVLRCQV